jgi:hypothetical protein
MFEPAVALAWWIQWPVAVALFLGIGAFGLSFLRGLANGRPVERVTPEDVQELEVFFVCGECGTEFQVTKLGQMQVPRHCGEPMTLVRRPRASPRSN